VPCFHVPFFPSSQNAAGVLGLASGFLFGSSFAVSGWLPQPLREIPPPIYLYSSVVHACAVVVFRLLFGVSITFAAKFVSERILKQVGVCVCRVCVFLRRLCTSPQFRWGECRRWHL
jgi:hypothetical protein